MELIPAIMPHTFQELKDHVEKVRGLVSTVQIDVMDGIFVEIENWPYTEKDSFNKLLYGEENFPYKGELKYEVDLMIKDPEYEAGKWLETGIDRIVLHVESTKNMQGVIDVIEARNGVEVGIALNTMTPHETVEPYLEHIDFIQCMGIARIGYQGEPFDERVIHKIIALRKAHPDVIIQVDGAVNSETAPRLLKAGASRLVSGSAIWESKDIAATIEEFKTIIYG